MPNLFALTPYLAVAVVLLLLAAIAWRVDDWGRDWNTNHAELRADSHDPQLRPVRVAESPRKAADRLTAALAGRSDWSIVAPGQADDETSEVDRTSDEHVVPSGETVRLHLTHRTSVFRFVDDVLVTIQPDGEGSIIAASSQSRLGKGDLGQNPRNLRELVSILRSELSAYPKRGPTLS